MTGGSHPRCVAPSSVCAVQGGRGAVAGEWAAPNMEVSLPGLWMPPASAALHKKVILERCVCSQTAGPSQADGL